MAEESKKKRGPARRYTEADDQFLIDNYKKITTKEICEALGRHYSSVANRILILGLSNPAEIKPEKYDDFIRENYHAMTNAEMCKVTGQTERQLTNRVRKLGMKLKRDQSLHSDGEKKFLFEECGNYTSFEMANLLKKNERYLRDLVRKEGLKFKPARGYSQAQFEFVRENYATMDTEELMKVVGAKSVHAVHYMAQILNVRKITPGKDGKKICKNCNRVLPVEEFQKVNNRSYHHTCKLCEHDKKIKKMFKENEGKEEKTKCDKARETWEAAVARGDTKVCSLCNEELPVSDFYYGKGKCKKCFNTSLKKQRLENIKKRGY